MKMTWIAAIILTGTLLGFSRAATRPHIIFMVADDLGWEDIGYNNHAGHVRTRTLDEFAAKGVKLNNSYVQPVCSPSRGSFMSGYYPFHTGLQHGIVENNKAEFLPSNFTLLPHALKELGYATHMVGKWHLGFCNLKYTPTRRGFDSFMGYYTGAEDYYTHMAGSGKAYDFRFNEDVYHPPDGEYSTHTFTNRALDIIHNHDPAAQPLFLYMAYQAVHSPLQVPSQYVHNHNHAHSSRATYIGMLSAMDESFRNITNALKNGGYEDNLLIIFTSDNGGSIHEGGSNYPLRGAKGTLWEGGTRAAGFVYSPPGTHSLFHKAGYISDDMIHAVDWYPTIVAAAGGIPDQRLDGINQWNTLSQGAGASRNEFVYNIDDVGNTSAIRVGDYKLIQGPSGHSNGWYQPGPHHHQEVSISGEPQLFNIRNDPTEHHDIAAAHPDIVQQLQSKIEEYKKTMVPSQDLPVCHHANPSNYNNVWSPGWC